MSSQKELSTCPVCYSRFNDNEYLPKISPTCGHTVCKNCLTQVLRNSNNPKCPLDQLPFGRDLRSINNFPTNFLVKELLQIGDKMNQCESHQEERKMICMTDRILLCGSCVLFGDHRDHDIRLLSDVQGQANIKKNQLSNILNGIAANFSESEKFMKEKEQATKVMIKEKFQLVYESIKKQEAQMLFKLDKMIGQEKTAILDPKFVEKASGIQKKLQEFPQILTNPNLLFEVLNEDFTELEKKVNTDIAITAQKMEEFSNLLAVFQDALPKEGLLKEMNVDNLAQLLADFNEKRQFNLEVVISPELSLDCRRENYLQVQKADNSNSKEDFLFEKSKLEKIEKVKYSFSLEDELKNKDTIVPTLLNLSKSLLNTKSVIFDFEASESIEKFKCDDERLSKILQASLSRPENIENLQFTFSNYILGDSAFIFLAQNALPKITNLKSFSMKLGDTKVSNQVLKALAQVNWKAWPNLEKLKLDISEPSFQENELTEFLNVVPNVKELTLGFGDSQLTDKALETFSTKILPSLDKLERFEVGFWGTKLTSVGVDKFLMNLPNIETILIGFGRIEITDDALKSFLEIKSSSLTKLEEFGFEISQENLSEEIAKKLGDWEEEIEQRYGGRRYKLPEETWIDAGKRSGERKFIKSPFNF